MISVIIPAYNDTDSLRGCLNALAQQTISQKKFEVIVVDNGSSRPISDSITPPPFIHIINEQQPGSYAARNTGVRSSQGDIIAFTDADCIPDPNWLYAIQQHFDNHGNSSLAGGKVQLTIPGRPTVVEDYEKCFGFRQEANIKESGYAVTANLVARRSTIEAVGPFNHHLFSGGDKEWCLRATEQGFKLDYVPEIIVYHPARSSVTTLLSKHRRITGGIVASSKASDSNLVYIAKIFIPSIPIRRALSLLFQHRAYEITLPRSIQVLGLLALVTIVSQSEKVLLLFGSKPQRK